MLEQMKLAMLAHIPVIYIPTDQMELIHEILYSDNTIDSLVPRVKYDSEKKAVVKLADKEYGVKDDEKRTFSSIKDNYLIFVNSIDSDVVRCPSILLTYTTKWDKVETGIRNFISDYMGMKRSKDNNPNPYHVANISRSLCIVVTPTEQVIPENIAPYVMTVRVPALLDEEIEAVIASEFNAESMDISVLRRSEVLYSQMIVSLRGFSVLRIRQLLRQMIASQSIDFNHVNADAVLAAIRVSKKQMLENCNGLKWEETNATNAAGLDSISKWLEERIDIFSDPERAAQCHTDIPNGLLISGIPGSGKSLMAKTAAYKLGLPLISLDMGALLNSLMGESEHNMINALRMSENMAPCVLWIDEIEKGLSGVQSSGATDGGVTSRIFSTILTWMQEKTAPVFVVATANNINQLPPELLRKGRFDEIFFVDLPSQKEKENIFSIHLQKNRQNVSSFALDILAQKAEGFNGAEIEECVKEAMFTAYVESQESNIAPKLQMIHILDAIKNTVPLSKTMEKQITDLRKFAVSRAKNASKEIVLENRMEMPILLTRPELELERSFDSVLSEKDSNSNNI